MNTFSLKVIASDKIFFDDKCQMVCVPAADGSKAFMAHHENMVLAVVVGEIKIVKEDGTQIIALCGNGLVQAVNNRITVLVDTIEKPEDIDVVRAREAVERAKEQMRQKQSIQEYHHSQASLARAMSRLKESNKSNPIGY